MMEVVCSVSPSSPTAKEIVLQLDGTVLRELHVIFN